MALYTFHIFDCVRPWQGPVSILVFQLYSSALLLAWIEICPLSFAMFLSGQVACNLPIESTQSLSQITSVCPIIILSPKMGQPIPQKCWYHCTAQSDGKTQRQSDDHLFLYWTCRSLFGSFILFWYGILDCHCNKSRETNIEFRSHEFAQTIINYKLEILICWEGRLQ